MSGSVITFPARLTIRATRAVLTTTRDVSQQALGVVDLIAQVVETPPADDMPFVTERRFEESLDAFTEELAGDLVDEIAVPAAVQVPAEDALDAFPEAVDVAADPAFTRAGAGAEPWAGYDRLRAADVVGRLSSADAAQLAVIELYESAHRSRRTVLDAVARELKRRPPAPSPPAQS